VERAEWSLRNEANGTSACWNKTIRGGVNGVYGMNTTTPLKKNEKNRNGTMQKA